MRLGMIGCGNMAAAMIKGILDKGLALPEEILASDSNAAARARGTALGVAVTEDTRKAAAWAEILVVAVKPQFYGAVLEEIRDCRPSGQVVVTIAPGISTEWVEHRLGAGVKVVRTMPNTPAMVGEGMTAVCCNRNVEQGELDRILGLLDGFGRAEQIPERLMDAAVSVGSSSPAYVFMFIEAMADAAVADGMPRAAACRIAAQAVLGSAKMVLETGKHPGELKDMVCSPGGTTIEAVRSLERHGFRGCVMEAMRACTEKAKRMV